MKIDKWGKSERPDKIKTKIEQREKIKRNYLEVNENIKNGETMIFFFCVVWSELILQIKPTKKNTQKTRSV